MPDQRLASFETDAPRTVRSPLMCARLQLAVRAALREARMSNEKDVAPREGKDNFERTKEVIDKKEKAKEVGDTRTEREKKLDAAADGEAK